MKKEKTKQRIEYLVDGISLMAVCALCAASAWVTWPDYGWRYAGPFLGMAVAAVFLSAYSFRQYRKYAEIPDERPVVARGEYGVTAILNLVLSAIWVGIGILELGTMEYSQAETIMRWFTIVIGVVWFIKACVQGWCWLRYSELS